MMKVRDVIRLIEEDGWRIARSRGSHRQYKHPLKLGLVTIAVTPVTIWRRARWTACWSSRVL